MTAHNPFKYFKTSPKIIHLAVMYYVRYPLSFRQVELLDEAKLGFEFSVFVSVQLDKQVDGTLAAFEAAIIKFPEVVDCWLMTGNRDYMLRIAVSSLAEFEHFLVGTLTKVQGVSSVESSIPLRRVKSGMARTL